MQRPTATAWLLGGTAFVRAVAIGLVAPEVGPDPLTAVLLVEVLVPLWIAVADVRGRPVAATAAVAHGALGAATLVATGLAGLDGGVATSPSMVAFLLASTLAMLAGATAVGRWQDRGAPTPGPGPRWLRAVAVAAATVIALLLVTADVAVIGAVPVGGGSLPGPVAVATTVSPGRVPLLLGALAPVAWAATRAGVDHLLAASVVVGARGVVEVAGDAALLALGAPVWPTAVGATAALVLLAGVPAAAQVTSSRA